LLWGFEGKYKLQGREKLKDLIHDLFRDIEGRRGEHPALSPHAERREEVLDLVKRDLPAWVVGVCSVSIVFFFYIALSVLIHQEGTTVAQTLQEFAERALP
jgi:type VI secretion system protein ImpK